ncbi:hypothetical protein [Methanosphaerula palustris]|uniref:Lipoprotein n=1 Tax=Methanosphaerula palustris (strain ATCC BAA-1556 / DSM 19958 / E1-9c) TaxID=521011 RepID=B8GHP0_METPE|nr:hypothetical protein [Methanosphaerula palustris]ACL16645.1 conserved hypothetical protein [Methanosphaerula palustris E1-9c]
MNWKIIAILLLSLAVMMMGAGCTTTPTVNNTTTTTTVPATTAGLASATGLSAAATTVAAATGGDNSLTPGPTQAMPKGNDVFVQVNQKDPIDHSITVIYNGGAGMNSVTGCTVHLIRSDGTDETKSLTTQTGSELTFKGTKNPDRIVVTVTTNSGQTYTIIDQMSALAPR